MPSQREYEICVLAHVPSIKVVSRLCTKKWGSLEGLAEKYANQMPADEFYLSEQIEPLNARSAKVTYETRYDDGAKRTWTDYLVLDESIWKLRPEHVEWREDRPPHVIP